MIVIINFNEAKNAKHIRAHPAVSIKPLFSSCPFRHLCTAVDVTLLILNCWWVLGVIVVAEDSHNCCDQKSKPTLGDEVI